MKPSFTLIKSGNFLYTASALLILGWLVSSPPVYAANPAVLTDTAIADAVDDELLWDPGVLSHNADVRSIDGIVTLSGKVDSYLAKQRAVRIARTIRGVRSVVDQLSVRIPEPVPDTLLAENVRQALLYDAATDAYEIKVTAENGTIHLTGSSESLNEKQLAGYVAAGVYGVRGIQNRLRVNLPESRPDDEIKADVTGSLERNIWTDETLIRVQVENGTVSLAGTVGSAAEKVEAAKTAFLAGAEDVNVQQLTVDPDFQEKTEKTAGRPPVSDEDIQRSVRDTFLYDPRVNSFNIRIEVTDRVVTLRGKVDNLRASKAAEDDVRNTAGVLEVQNRLKVRAETQVPDKKIEERVEAAIARDAVLKGQALDISAVNGIVYLTGWVENEFQKSRAQETATRTRGVAEVRNYLEARDPRRYSYEPYVDFWYPYDGLHTVPDNTAWSGSDSRLLDKIESQLFWSPFIDHTTIDIQVRNGVATLSGEVETWKESVSAASNAYDAGAFFVVNQLAIV